MADTEYLLTRQEIEKRAYELYLQAGEGCSPEEYWLMAEKELKRERVAGDIESVKKKAAGAGPGNIIGGDK